MEVNFEYNLENLIESWILKIMYGIVVIIGLLTTLIFALSFIYYEHYGGDPMKRSIKVRRHYTTTFHYVFMKLKNNYRIDCWLKWFSCY